MMNAEVTVCPLFRVVGAHQAPAGGFIDNSESETKHL